MRNGKIFRSANFYRMKKIIWGLGLLVIAVAIQAQVGVISVVDEDKHTVKSDFFHTFEYQILHPGKEQMTMEGYKCQATRIGWRWFVTAAHCVRNICKNGCQIEMDLLDQSTTVLATVQHTPKNPAVFVYPETNSFVDHDFALIRLDVDRAPKGYYKRVKNGRTGISKQQFEQFLEETPAARRMLYNIKKPVLPPILVFDAGNYILDRKISVISIFDGVRSVKLNPNPVHYVKELGFAYTKNFGIRKGMSGSGVMSNTGELVGICSVVGQAFAPGPNSDDRMQITENWFIFFVFNNSILDFMESVMGSDFGKLDIKDAYPNYVHKSRKNYTSMIMHMKKLSSISFGKKKS